MYDYKWVVSWFNQDLPSLISKNDSISFVNTV